MKKYFFLLLLAFSLSAYSQADSTKINLAKYIKNMTQKPEFKDKKIKAFVNGKEIEDPSTYNIDLMAGPEIQITYPKKVEANQTDIEVRITTKDGR